MYISLYNYYMVKEEVLINEEISEAEINRKNKPRLRKAFSVTWTILLVTAIVVSLFVTYVDLTYTPVYVDGPSMQPTLNDFHHRYYEFGLMDERPKARNNIKRGDIVVFRRNGINIIKRVIALPLETIQIIDNPTGDEVFITLPEATEKFKLDEPYLSTSNRYTTATYLNDSSPKYENGLKEPLTLEEKTYYLMGDNRANSSDSRAIGPVHFDNISGKLVVIQGYTENVEVSESGKVKFIGQHYYVLWKWRYY
jgi:signal peptidase I